jgi:predicted aldo/keto reductase-like oxidoreductase
MEYRKLGGTGLDIGVVGLGTEHIERSVETMDLILGTAVDAGVNYIDLLYIEDDYWEQFGHLFRAYRDKLVLAAHWSSGPVYDLDFCQRTFANVLSQVGNDYIEVAMMTMIDDGARKGDEWREASLKHLRRYQEQGHVGYIGGSAHDEAAALDAVNSGLLDVLMFPVNMLSHDNAKSQELIQACADQGVGLVAMKPYHGGTLLFVNGQPSGITPAQCLDYVFSLPVSTAVPGPKNLDQWQITLRYLDAEAEERAHRPVLADLRERLAGQCVYCHHCLPCPQDIEIGWLIWTLDQTWGGVGAKHREWYAEFPVGASACVECGICVERCPFDVDIMAKMHEAVALFEGQATV